MRFLVTLKTERRSPPNEFRLIPLGAYETTKGTFYLTPANAQTILAQLEDEGVDSVIDWEHESVDGTPGRKDAAGWFKVELRGDGLWATGVKWVEDASQAISAAKVRYISPAFTVDEDTNEITKFINCALTNRPATKKAPALVAASKDGQPMHKKFLAALAQHMKDNNMDHAVATKKCGVDTGKLCSEGYTPSQEEMEKCAKGLGFQKPDEGDGENQTDETASAMNNHDVDQTDNTGADDSDAEAPGGTEGKAKVKAADTADVPGEEKFEKLTKEFTDALVQLTGEKNVTKARGVLVAMKEKAMAYDKDHAVLVKLTKEREEEKRMMLIDNCKAEGKLTPSLIKLFSKKPVEELEAFLDHAPVITGAEVHQVEAGTPIALLKKEDREVAMLLNRDPATVAKRMEDERAGKFEQEILASYYARPQKSAAK